MDDTQEWPIWAWNRDWPYQRKFNRLTPDAAGPTWICVGKCGVVYVYLHLAVYNGFAMFSGVQGSGSTSRGLQILKNLGLERVLEVQEAILVWKHSLQMTWLSLARLGMRKIALR